MTPRAEEGSAGVDARFEISSSPESSHASGASTQEVYRTPPRPARAVSPHPAARAPAPRAPTRIALPPRIGAQQAARVRHHRRTTSSDEEFIDEWLETWAEWPSPSNSRHLRRAGRAASHDGVVEPGVWAYPVQREQHPPTLAPPARRRSPAPRRATTPDAPPAR